MASFVWYRNQDDLKRARSWHSVSWYTDADGGTYELEYRWGRDDDSGWYLFGPHGRPFGKHLSRRIADAKRDAEQVIPIFEGDSDAELPDWW
jgi:hypothetical protein